MTRSFAVYPRHPCELPGGTDGAPTAAIGAAELSAAGGEGGAGLWLMAILGCCLYVLILYVGSWQEEGIESGPRQCEGEGTRESRILRCDAGLLTAAFMQAAASGSQRGEPGRYSPAVIRSGRPTSVDGRRCRGPEPSRHPEPSSAPLRPHHVSPGWPETE